MLDSTAKFYKIDIGALLKDSLRTIFNMRRGEELRSLLMFCYIFLIISALMIIKPVCNSLFLSEFGASKLPYVFILVAVFAAGVSAIYSKLLKIVNLNYLIKRSLQVAMASLLVFWVFLFFKILLDWVLYIFYVWVAIFAVISVSQFYILANFIFDLREAKRLFGFIGAGAIFGGILGGYFAKLFAPIIGSENLIFTCIGFLFLCVPIINLLTKENLKIADRYDEKNPLKTTPIMDHPLRLIIRSRHLAFLASIIGISVVAAKLVEFQFSAIASTEITDEDQLTAFFGFWLSNLNIISLLIQLFVTRHVVGVFGVGTSLFFLPAGILLGAIGIFIYPALWTAVLLKICDGSLKNSINKAGIELLGLPIPIEIKNKTKPFIDVFVDSFATGIGGLLLVFLTLGLNFSVRYISFIIILLLIGWIYLVIQVKKEYIQTFRLKIEKPELQQPITANDLMNESVFDGLIRVLRGRNNYQILNALKIVKQIQNNRLLPCFERLINHPSNEIRLEVLRNIYFYKNVDFKSKVLELVNDEDQEIKTEAIQYLFQHTTNNRIGFLQAYLQHQDYRIKHAALLCAARESRTNLEYQNVFGIRSTIEETFKKLYQIKDQSKLEFIKINVAKAIAAIDIVDLYAYLHILLKDSSPKVIKTSIYNAGLTRNIEFIPVLISKLADERFHETAKDALLHFGEKVLEILIHYLNDPFEDRNVRINIPKILSSIGAQKSVNALMQHLEHSDHTIRDEIVKALNRLRASFPELEFDEKRIVTRILDESKTYASTLAVLYSEVNANQTLVMKDSATKTKLIKIKKMRRQLIKVLEKRLDNNLERIFRLLDLNYPQEDIYNVYLGVRSKKLDLRVNAVEFLDNLLTVNLKKVIIPIVETTLVDALIEKTLEQLGLKIPSEFDCLVMLLSEDDTQLKAITLLLIAELQDERYVSYVGSLIHSSDPTIKVNAELVLKKIGIL